MSDDIYLQVGKFRLKNFKSYRIDSDLFQAADDFEITVANPQIDVSPGQKCELYVNGQPELVGVIDRISENVSKTEHTLTLAGRDLMGLVVDSDIEIGKDLTDTTIQALAEELLTPLPYIDRDKIIYGVGGKINPVPYPSQGGGGGIFSAQAKMRINPGEKIFTVLKNYALSIGLLFFYTPAGKFVFGTPVRHGTKLYDLIRRKNGRQTNILSGGPTEDISQQYKTVTVLGEQQNNLFAVGGHQKSGNAENSNFPLSYKPMVVRTQYATDDLAAQAELIIKKQVFNGSQRSYKVVGHSQAGNNYQPNTIIHVIDEMLLQPVNADFLIFGRTFERSKDEGTTTTLRLSKLGLLPF